MLIAAAFTALPNTSLSKPGLQHACKPKKIYVTADVLILRISAGGIPDSQLYCAAAASDARRDLRRNKGSLNDWRVTPAASISPDTAILLPCGWHCYRPGLYLWADINALIPPLPLLPSGRQWYCRTLNPAFMRTSKKEEQGCRWNSFFTEKLRQLPSKSSLPFSCAQTSCLLLNVLSNTIMREIAPLLPCYFSGIYQQGGENVQCVKTKSWCDTLFRFWGCVEDVNLSNYSSCLLPCLLFTKSLYSPWLLIHII